MEEYKVTINIDKLNKNTNMNISVNMMPTSVGISSSMGPAYVILNSITDIMATGGKAILNPTSLTEYDFNPADRKVYLDKIIGQLKAVYDKLPNERPM